MSAGFGLGKRGLQRLCPIPQCADGHPPALDAQPPQVEVAQCLVHPAAHGMLGDLMSLGQVDQLDALDDALKDIERASEALVWVEAPRRCRVDVCSDMSPPESLTNTRHHIGSLAIERASLGPLEAAQLRSEVLIAE